MATFQMEAEDYIKGILSGLGAIENALDDGALQESALVEPVFRQFHSLKGASQAIGFDHVGKICQESENVLSVWKKNPEKASKSELSTIMESALSAAAELNISPGLSSASVSEPASVDSILHKSSPDASSEQVKAEAEPARRENAASGSSPAQQVIQKIKPAIQAAQPGGMMLKGTSMPAAQETLRISADKLDLLLRRGEQLVLARLNSRTRWTESQNLLSSVMLLRRMLQEQISNSGEENPFMLNIMDELRNISSGLQRHTRSLGSDYHELNNQLRSLLIEVKSARLAPVRPLLEELEIAARRITRQLAKKVRINVSGRELELDRSIMESLKDPLIHLVRNALDHGLESVEERRAKNKTPEGHLNIDVVSKGTGMMEFSVSDDGRGIQTDEVLAAARQQGLIVDGVDVNSLDLIFTSGVSTRSEVTDISGRGLGMAIVREKVEMLKGSVRVLTKIGEGTTFILSIPTSLATFDGLLVKEEGRFMVFPLSGVEAVTKVKFQDIFVVEGNQVIRYRGGISPITRLGQLLQIPSIPKDENPSSMSAVIVSASGRRLALIVDEIFGVQEVLSRDLGPQLKKVRFIMGACMLGYRQVVPVLNISDLLTNVRGASRVVTRKTERIPQALVADDSITTRTLIRGMLEAAGYKVRVAADGSQAWEILQQDKFDLLISDVDMPGITGFDLTIKVRSNGRLSKLPVILITGQERIEDRQRGLKLGASAYITKSSFDKGLLLETVTRLIGEVKTAHRS